MLVRFLRDWTNFYTVGSTATIGPGGLSRGQFLELERRGLVEVVEEEPESYRVAVAKKPAMRRKPGRPKRMQ